MNKILFVIIFILALFLRTYNLETLPSGFYNDEASFLVNAISIHQTGRDEDGKRFPLMLRSFIDPKPALYSYLQIPFVTLLGPTTTAARMPGVLLGLASIVLMYLLLRQFLSGHGSLLGMAIMSISPWHIVLSRGSQEVIMAFCFSILTLLLFVLLQKPKTNIFIYLGFFASLLLSLYSYPSAKVLLPLFLFASVGLSVLQKKASIKKACLLLGIVITTIIILIPITDTSRFHAVSIFTSPQTLLLLNDKISTATSHAPAFIIRLFNNKFVDYGYLLLSNYAVYFGGRFLFFGLNQPQRYQVPFTGILYPVEAIFLLAGVFSAFSQNRLRKYSVLMTLWLGIAPLAASVTSQEIPSMIRAFTMLVPLTYFITLGLVGIVVLCKTQKVALYSMLIITTLAYSYSIGYFWFNYSIQQVYYRPWYRDYGDEELVAYIERAKISYEKIYLSNSSYSYFVIRSDISIKDLQSSYPHRFDPMFHVGKFIFVTRDCYLSKESHTLFAIKGATCTLSATQKEQYRLVAKIKFKDGNPAYYLYEYLPPRATEKIPTENPLAI